MAKIDELYKQNLKPYPCCPHCGNTLTVDLEHNDISCLYCHKCKEIHGTTIYQMIHNWNKYCAEILDNDRNVGLLIVSFTIIFVGYFLEQRFSNNTIDLLTLFICIIVDIICLENTEHLSYLLTKLRIKISIQLYELKLKKKEKVIKEEARKEEISNNLNDCNDVDTFDDIDSLIKQLSLYEYDQVKTIIDILTKIKSYNNIQFNKYILNDSINLINALNTNVTKENQQILEKILTKYIDLFNRYLLNITDFDINTIKLKAILMDLNTKI